MKHGLMALLVVCSACGSPTPAASPTPTPMSGGPTAEPTTSPAPISDEAGADLPASSRIDLTLVDHNDGHPAGIPVDISGHGRVESDAQGHVRVDLAPGDYGVQVVSGCHELVQVASGGSAQLGVAAGQVTVGELVVTWQHRFGPAPPVFASQNEDFPVDQDVTLSFAVRDRCDDREAPGASLPTFAVVPSEAMVVAEQPELVADAEGQSDVTVRCTRAGEASVVLRDRTNPIDEIDLVDHLSGFGGRPRCA